MIRKVLSFSVLTGTLLGCGGSEPPSETFVVYLTSFYEASSVERFQTALRDRGVRSVEYRCGVFDNVNYPGVPPATADGRSQRYLLVTVYPSDVESVQSIRLGIGIGMLPPPINRETFAQDNYSSPSYPCDPAVEASKGPFGGYG